MKILKIIQQIKNFRKTPVDQSWLKDGRESLHTFISKNPVRKPDLVRQQMSGGLFNKLALKPMPIAIIALIITLTTGGGAAYAAQDSLPTDILYPVKLATESIQETLTFDQVKKIELQIKLAYKRLEEIEELQDKNQATETVVSQTLDKYKNHLAKAQKNLNEIDHKNPSKVIAAAIEIEAAAEKNQVLLESIEAEALSEYRPTLIVAKKITLNNSDQTLKKMEVQINEIQSGNKEGLTETVEGVAPTLSSKAEEDYGYTENLDQSAKNRIQRVKNKLNEIKNKINIFTEQKNNKCSQEEKSSYFNNLDEHYQKMTGALEEAERLYQEKNYPASLRQSNYVFSLALDVDNLIGQWNSRCGGVWEQRVVPFNQKFEMKVREAVQVEGQNIQITLTSLTTSCPPCPQGQVCTLSCPAPNAQFTIGYLNKEGMRQITLSLNQQEEISNNIYLTLLAVSENSVTLTLTQKGQPEEKNVYLNQKFGLTPSQAARVVDYQDMRIKFQSIADVVCVKAPCPSPIAGFEVSMPNINKCNIVDVPTEILKDLETPISTGNNSPGSTQKCFGSSTGTNFSLAVGQSRNVFGVEITLLSLTSNTATLIVTKNPIVCSAPNCIGVYQTGEYDRNGCLIYKCPIEQDCGIPICENNVEPYFTGEYNSNGCKVYKCPEKECEAIFSHCNCSYNCVEITPDELREDCTKICSPEETKNYRPNCGYLNGVCQDLIQQETESGDQGVQEPTNETESTTSAEGKNILSPIADAFNAILEKINIK